MGGVASSRTSPVSRWSPRTSPSSPAPVGSSRGRRGPWVWTSIVTSTGLLDPRLPPRPMVSRTGSSPTSTLPTPRTAPPGPPRLDESTGVQGPCHLTASSAGDGLGIEPYYQPVLPRRDRLLRGRSTGQNAYCTPPGSSHDAGPPCLDDSPLRPRARLLQGRHVRSDHAPRPGDSRTSPRLTTAHSVRPPGPSAGSSARGCSARGTSGASDPGSLK
jgi:hypothetical protein